MRSAADNGRMIAQGRLDPVAQTEAYLAQATPEVFARMTPERALAEAMAARERARTGSRFGPLDGVALSWKDNFDSAGTPTEAGSRLLAGRLPARDADALAQVSHAGGVCLGKTHMTELAFSGLGINPMTASPANAIDPARASGGSSSGAAISVKRGMAAAAIGSDTGGSIRIPSAWNDLVGFKPTHGRISSRGVVPLCARFDTVGPIARSVEDCALLLAALEGGRAADLREASLAGARLLVLEGVALSGVRAEPMAGFEAAVERLARAGAQITRATVPCVEAALDLSGYLFAPEAYATWREAIEAQPSRMYPPILERFRAGGSVLATDYLAAVSAMERHRASYLAQTAGYDAVLVPTSAILPPDAARLVSDPAYFAAENLLALRNTRIANVLGLAALTLPSGVPMTGISLMAAPMQEEQLLRLGAAAEAALGVAG